MPGRNSEGATLILDTTVLEKGVGSEGGRGPSTESLLSVPALMPQTRNLVLAKVAWQVIARMEC